jgi:hypothetical protein
MLRPQLCGEVNAKREDAGNRADDRAAQKAVAQESDHLHETCFDLEENCFHLVSEVIAVEIHILPPVYNEPENENNTTFHCSISRKKPQEKGRNNVQYQCRQTIGTMGKIGGLYV